MHQNFHVFLLCWDSLFENLYQQLTVYCNYFRRRVSKAMLGDVEKLGDWFILPPISRIQLAFTCYFWYLLPYFDGSFGSFFLDFFNGTWHFIDQTILQFSWELFKGRREMSATAVTHIWPISLNCNSSSPQKILRFRWKPVSL